ncbi:MAG TPA: penicillin-insensitive murein endopeptidase, partial [Afipia sp.]|nr:penicillin-insensitive murein endopeptidase [Afipia sp.]
MIRFRLIPALALMSAALAVTVPAQAQDKGSVNPKPL